MRMKIVVQVLSSRQIEGLCGETKGKKVREVGQGMQCYRGDNDRVIQSKGHRDHS